MAVLESLRHLIGLVLNLANKSNFTGLECVMTTFERAASGYKAAALSSKPIGRASGFAYLFCELACDFLVSNMISILLITFELD